MSWYNPLSWFAGKQTRQSRRRRGRSSAVFTPGSLSGPGRNLPNVRSDVTDFDFETTLARPLAIGRSVVAHTNNPLYANLSKGARARTLGAELMFRAAVPKGKIPGLGDDDTDELNRLITDYWRAWSEAGEADHANEGMSVGMLQGKAFIDCRVRGGVLIHVLEQPENEVCPISFELIDVARMRRPAGADYDPNLVNEAGIQFTDKRHSRVAGYWVEVREGLSRTSHWEYYTTDEACLYSAEKLAGIESALPPFASVLETIRSLGLFRQYTLDAAVAHAQQPITVNAPNGGDPRALALAEIEGNAASDDDEEDSGTPSTEFVDLGGVEARYLPYGALVNRANSALPGPEIEKFTAFGYEAVSAGAGQSFSRVSKRANGSYSAGRMEQQNDNPQIEIDCEAFIRGPGRFMWNKFVEALWVYGILKMPGYRQARPHYRRFAVTVPATESLNPVQGVTADRSAVEGGFDDEIDVTERTTGKSYEDVQRRRAVAFRIRRKIEIEEKVPPLCLEGKTQTGALLTDPTPKAGAGDEAEVDLTDPAAAEAGAEKTPAD